MYDNILSTIRIRVRRICESIRHFTHTSSGETATARTITAPSADLPFVRVGSTDLMCSDVVEPNLSTDTAVGPCIICFEDVEKCSLAMLDCDCQYVAHEQCIGLWEQTHPQRGCIVCRKSIQVLTDTNGQWERIKSHMRSLATLSLMSLVFYIALVVHDMYQ